MDAQQGSMDIVLGDAVIDGAHRALFDQLQWLEGTDETEFTPACIALFALLEKDFRAEEDVMEQIGYGALADHREQHARVLGGLHHALAALDKGDARLARQAVRLLRPWMELHIATQDAAMMAAARAADARLASEGAAAP